MEDPLDGFLLGVSIQEEVGEQFTCGICDASFLVAFVLKKSNLKQHLKTHSHFIARSAHTISHNILHLSNNNAKHRAESQLHVCTSCGITFYRMANLNIHQSRFHEMDHWHIASDVILKQKEKLHDHMNIHTGSKPYS